MLKKYQPERTDLLINTEWGIPSAQLSRKTAKTRGLKLFHDRWVTGAEKKQLKDEQNAYFSIRVIGCLLLLPALLAAINIGQIFQNTLLSIAFAITYCLFAVGCGIGLIRFTQFTRYPAALIFFSFFILPFTPFLENEKGAPLLIVLGIAGFYYLLRRTARKIFWPQSCIRSDHQKINSVFLKIIYGLLLLGGLWVGYFIYDLYQAKQMAAAACIRSLPGLPLKDFLSKFPDRDYKIIREAKHLMIVPKRGLGRNYCRVEHDGQNIIGSNTGFND